LKEIFEVAYRAERVELQNRISFLEHIDKIISQQQPFHVLSDPMVLYIENFTEVEMNDKENNHTISIYSEKDLAFENLEQEKSTFEENDTMKKEACILLYTCEQEGTIDTSCPLVFIDQQVVFTHILQYPFSFLLETSEKETFMSCIKWNWFFKWMSFQIGFNF
jgi:hypothetical protein